MSQKELMMDGSSAGIKMLRLLAQASRAGENGARVVFCAVKFLLNSGLSQPEIKSGKDYLKRPGFLESKMHRHHGLAGSCSDWFLSPKGVEFINKNGLEVGTKQWQGNAVDRIQPVKEEIVVKTPRSQSSQKEATAKIMFTARHWSAAELLLGQAAQTGSNGKNQLRVVNPAVLLRGDVAYSLEDARLLVEDLLFFGFLNQVQDKTSDNGELCTYQVKKEVFQSRPRPADPASVSNQINESLRKLQEDFDLIDLEKDEVLEKQRQLEKEYKVKLAALDQELEVLAEKGNPIQVKIKALRDKQNALYALLSEIQEGIAL